MLRICIPVHNEATTIGVLLWRLRSVFQGFSREYDVTVYDDASTDGTAEVLEPYQSVMPLTVLRGHKHVGYAGSIDALVRHVAADDEYARRDAMVLLQGDFTESPEHLPELVKRFEGGADLVAVHRITSVATPADERRLRRWGRWAVTPFLRMPPVADPFTGFRLVRISVLRDLLKAMGNRPVCSGDGWAANIDFALNVTPFARRIENVEFAPRFDVRQRASRRRGWADVVALFHWARSARSTVRPAPGTKPSADQPVRGDALVLGVPAERARPSAPERERGGRPERSRLPREGGEARPPAAARDIQPQREDAESAAEPAREARPPREGRNAREERALRGEERAPKVERPARESRESRPPKPERTERADPTLREEREAVAIPFEESPYSDVELQARPPGGVPTAAPTESPEQSAAAPTGDKKRRRRRRSRKDRAGRAADGTEDTDGDSAGDVEADRIDQAGTSESGEGQQEEGDDDTDSAESGSSAESGAEGARRKRRPRRRRRGRRPGGSEGGVTDGEAPVAPAAEPPPAA